MSNENKDVLPAYPSFSLVIDHDENPSSPAQPIHNRAEPFNGRNQTPVMAVPIASTNVNNGSEIRRGRRLPRKNRLSKDATKISVIAHDNGMSVEEILERLIYNTQGRDGKPNELEIPQRKMFALVKAMKAYLADDERASRRAVQNYQLRFGPPNRILRSMSVPRGV